MRVTLKAKLGVTFAVVILLSAVSMFIALQALGTLNESFSAAMNGNVERIKLANGLESATLKMARDESNLVVTTDTSEMTALVQAIDEDVAAITADAGKLHDLSDDQGKALVESFDTAFGTWLTQHQEVRRLALMNADAEAHALASKGAEIRKQAVDTLDQIEALNDSQLDAATVSAEKLYSDSRTFLFALLGGSAIIAIGAALWIVISMSRALSAALGLANAVAGGDLNAEARVKSND